MNSPGTSTNVAWLITFAACLLSSSGAQASAPESLKGKSNAELVQLVTGRTEPLVEKKERYSDEEEVSPSPLDRLWEMPPREAALAFATQYISEEVEGLVLKIDEPDAQPPRSGEIGLRWRSSTGYAPPEQGVTILKYDGYKSGLLLSQVVIAGRASEEEIENMVMKTDSHPLPRLVAQQAYEILWWLRHIRPVNEVPTRAPTFSTGDDDG